MDWDTLNSPLVITIVSFVLGGVLASGISAMWQRRSQRHAVRLELTHGLLQTYHEYMRFLRRDETVEEEREFDQLHAELMSKAKIARVLFGRVQGDALVDLAQRMANVQALRSGGRKQKAENQRTEIYQQADGIIEQMFLRLG